MTDQRPSDWLQIVRIECEDVTGVALQIVQKGKTVAAEFNLRIVRKTMVVVFRVPVDREQMRPWSCVLGRLLGNVSLKVAIDERRNSFGTVGFAYSSAFVASGVREPYRVSLVRRYGMLLEEI